MFVISVLRKLASDQVQLTVDGLQFRTNPRLAWRRRGKCLQPVPADALVECPSRDSKFLCGIGLVAVALAQYRGDNLALTELELAKR
jgi:hypothetical protein